MNRGQGILAGVSAVVIGAVVTWGILANGTSAPEVTPTSGLVTGGTFTPSPSASPLASSLTSCCEAASPSATDPADDQGGAGASASGASGTTATGGSTGSTGASCADADVSVSDADSLSAALKRAAPGEVIAMAPGTYVGQFVATASGTAGKPITLCGTAASIIDGDGLEGGYGFHLDGAKYWVLSGFAITNAQKGVVADGTVGSLVTGLTVHHIGDEGIHLRDFSTDNVVRGNTVFDTGNRREKFGEGIYIGSANSNWCTISDCKPDTSDRNLVTYNTIYDTTAENVDIKEGTSGGVLSHNAFDGSDISSGGGDSWVDVKGNDWVIEANVGVNTPMDGFQVHNVADGWGKGNVFRDNTATVNGPGYGFAFRPEQNNVVECSNSVSNAKKGLSNVSCR